MSVLELLLNCLEGNLLFLFLTLAACLYGQDEKEMPENSVSGGKI